MTTMVNPVSPTRGNTNVGHHSPIRSSSAATALQSILSQSKSRAKTPMHTSSRTPTHTANTPTVEAHMAWAPPTPTIEATMSKTHHVTLEMSTIRLKNCSQDKFNSSLSLRLVCEGETKLLSQKGFTFTEGTAIFDIKESCVFATKSTVPRIVADVYSGNNVLATGVLSIDIVKHLSCPVENNVGELSKWNKFPLAMQKGSKHVQVTEIVGEMEAAFDVKGEMYWSDSEGSGGTLTNTSAATTPASVLSVTRTPLTAGSVKSTASGRSTTTPKARPGLSISPAPAGPVAPIEPVLTPKADKENAFSPSSASATANTAANATVGGVKAADVVQKAPKSILKKEVTIHTPTSVKRSAAPVSKAHVQAPAPVQEPEEEASTLRVSLSSEMQMEAEDAVAPAVANAADVVAAAAAPACVTEAAKGEAEIEGQDNTGRWIWFGLVVLHMFLQH